MAKILYYVVRRLVDWFTRVRSPFAYMLTSGVFLIGLIFLGINFSLIVPTHKGPFFFSFDSGSTIPPPIVWSTFVVAVVLLLFGAIGAYLEFRRSSRKRVFVIEVRGLRDWNGTSLEKAIPSHLQGQRELVVIDLRQRVEDGVIVDPEAAMNRIAEIRSQIETREHGRERSDLSYVYGGIAPVPLTFLAGVCLDDESLITILDWDRNELCWRELDEQDDGQRFKVTGTEKNRSFNPKVTVAISASYKVDIAGALKRTGDADFVHLELEEASFSSHWSQEKQSKLSSQFLEVMKYLQDRGVKEIDLFLAGPNSLVLRFGMAYDKRNLPALTVYQYDRGATPPFTWGIQMPVAGKTRPNVVH